MALVFRPLFCALLPAAASLATAGATTGCFWVTTKGEGKQLREDVTSLEQRVTVKEDELTVKVKQLRDVLDDATKVLKRSSADIGADLEQLREDVRKASGLISAINHDVVESRAAIAKVDSRINDLEQRLAVLEAKGAAPTTPEEMWSLAKTAFEASRFDESKDLFRKLAQQYPGHERADDAQYFRGEAFYKQSDFDGAIREYQRLIDKYADSSLADDALFRAAEAAFSLKNCSEARAYLGLLKQKYPRSTLIKSADSKDKEIRAAAKDAKKCAS
jgi:tol-pal system protein YbgF